MRYLRACAGVYKKDKIFLEESVIIYINIQSKPMCFDHFDT